MAKTSISLKSLSGQKDIGSYVPVDSLWSPKLYFKNAWYDAADTTTITKNASNLVSQINDKSTFGNHLTQSNDNNKPTTVNYTINSLNVLRSVGGTSVLSKSIGVSAGNNSHAVIYCGRLYQESESYRDLYNVTDETSRTKITNNVGTPIQVYPNCTGDTAVSYPLGAFKETGTLPFIHVVMISGSSYTYRFNGANVATGTATVTRTLRDITLINIGNFISASFWDFGEMLIIPYPTNLSELYKIEGYLSNKWGVGLDPTNPYYLNPPRR